MGQKTIIMGADAWGLTLKDAIKSHIEKKGYETVDVGMHSPDKEIPYYEIAAAAAKKIQQGEAARGILFCGTGMGVALVANKFKGIYAGVVESEFTGKMCRVVNNCNVLTMGGMIVSEFKAKLAVDAWLDMKHAEGLDAKLADFLKQSLVKIAQIEDANFA